VLRITENRLERYMCPQSTFNSTDPARPGSVQGVYNELASLMDVPGEALWQSDLASDGDRVPHRADACSGSS